MVGVLCFCLFFLMLFEGPPAWAGAKTDRILRIGLLEEPKTLNIWMASDAWSNKVLSQIHEPLFVREPGSLRLIPWLAEREPLYEAETLSYTVRLREARWSDGSPVTAEDVAFTGEVIQAFKIPRFYSNWRFVKKIETLDARTIRFFLQEPRAIFRTRTLTTPIVQKAQWAEVVNRAKASEKPLIRLFNHRIEKPVGTGPFVLEEWEPGAYLFLQENPYFFGRGETIAGHELGPFIDGLIFKKFGTPDAAVLALRKGSIDFFWWGIQAGYIPDLIGDQNIRLFSNEKSAIYYLGFNLRKPPFNDLRFRRAAAMLIDKNFIMRRILQGYALEMHAVIPPGNTAWHLSEDPGYGSGLDREARIRKAHRILQEGGYTWRQAPVDEKGRVVQGEGIRSPDGSVVDRIRILTPPADYDPLRAMTGIMIQEWLKMAGIPAAARPMSLNAMTHQVRDRREFDLFVLGYGNLSLDPDYVRNLFHSRHNRPRGWNTSGYENPAFDRLADESAACMDEDKRKALVREMQRLIMRDIPFLPLYNPKIVEPVRVDRFTGWVEMVGGIGNRWSFCGIK